MYGGPWPGRLVPCPFRGANFPPCSSSIIAKCLETIGTQTRERRYSMLLGCLLAGPRSVEQCRGRARKGTSRDLFQALFSPCIELAEGPQLCVVVPGPRP